MNLNSCRKLQVERWCPLKNSWKRATTELAFQELEICPLPTTSLYVFTSHAPAKQLAFFLCWCELFYSFSLLVFLPLVGKTTHIFRHHILIKCVISPCIPSELTAKGLIFLSPFYYFCTFYMLFLVINGFPSGSVAVTVTLAV